jgi:hypothetical protein
VFGLLGKYNFGEREKEKLRIQITPLLRARQLAKYQVSSLL